jgi:intracellular sulfur oxidation DsrE/DsrF family protein
MKTLVLILTLLASVTGFSQIGPKVILHLQSSDTLVHKSIVNQIGNIKKEIPDAEIELVCHGPGLEFLLKEKSQYINKLNKLKLKNVSYVGCEFTMTQKKIKREELVDFAKTVPYGIAEIIKKQQQDWLYVKLGF